MATIILQVPNENLADKVKQACEMLVGVTSVKIQKENCVSPKYDITKTKGFKEAMDDVAQGRVYHAESVDDLFNKILG